VLPRSEANGVVVSELPAGKLLSEVAVKSIEWLLDPLIPCGMVTAVVGEPGVGKSTFEAHLCRLAGRAIVLPGEEDVARLLKPRMLVNGVDPATVRVILPGSEWYLPECKERLIRAIQFHRARLLVLDPIDDYLPPGFLEADACQVRQILQALRQVAEATAAAVVLCRHPGKDPNNVMVGSRVWRALPRSIVELLRDPGPPVRFIIRPYKDSLGREAPARYYDLVGEKGEPKVWRFGEVVAEEVVRLAKAEPDRIERKKIDQAADLLRALLACGGEMESSEVYRAGEREGLKDRTIRYAAERLAVSLRREGTRQDTRCYWSMRAAHEAAGQTRPDSQTTENA
jgi:hypothetical protein